MSHYRCKSTHHVVMPLQNITLQMQITHHMLCPYRINPFGLATERFLVAEDNQGQLVGFGQLQQQPTASDVQFLELRTLIVREGAR